jgi:tetratricopeptide (TPR) repeat protein
LNTRIILLFLIPALVLCCAGPLAAQEAHELIKAGDAAYLERSESMEQVKKAIKKWEHASMVDSKDPSPMYKIAMAYCFLGRFAKTSDEAEKMYTTAYEFAKKAVEKDGKCGPAHYWLAYSLHQSVANKNKFAKLAVKGDITSHFITARSIDPKYYFGGPDRGIATLALKSPVPTLALARKYVDDSLAHAPDYSANLILAAEVALKEGKRQEAKDLLEKVMKQKPMPGFDKELADDQKNAQSLLDQIRKM